ncbi:MAG: PVC-type heme-binding CxxCH protein [Pirellulaceae bacterium]|nr:PVC-type heme-binding CxxCH protein [Pirellulaceae bacterium]
MRKILVLFFLALWQTALIAEEFVPRKQTSVPGPPLSPAEALKKFQVPDGFHVELVAAEPDLLNPVAMAFDDRGRIYVTESFEYPRREPGPGRDRIKILEDTDGDGRTDSVKIFAEGLNIPSGIAVGHGGVWVANAPDILFIEDTDGDDKADRTTVVVTGFGRADTHELPNALTWGPDGCLYGLNGVFNPCHVEQDNRVLDFTCAMFRIDPRTRKFDLFCEGTSNPWGIAFDHEGSAFISACVIDHLWHLTETAYYHRQGGPYPPHTWKAESIVKHSHQMAAYCGIEYLDSDVFPPAYRDKLCMGNIHGSCINVDRVERAGATYTGFGEPDFMTANDVWFMPVVQKVGPDGCLYVLDWYDRYHCYQDANADPKGVDRGHGRLYRVVYGDRPAVKIADFSKLPSDQLVAILSDGNIYNRRQAQLELSERQVAIREMPISEKLMAMSLDSSKPIKERMHAVWSIIGSGPVPDDRLQKWLASESPELRSWSIRTAGRQQNKSPALIEQVNAMAKDKDPRVRIQVAIASPKIDMKNATATLLDVLKHSQPDAILPNVVWQNLLPLIISERSQVIAALESTDGSSNDLLASMAPRIATYWTSEIEASLESEDDRQTIETVLKMTELLYANSESAARETLNSIIAKIEIGTIRGPSIQKILEAWLKSTAAQKSATKLARSILQSNVDKSEWSQTIEQLKVLSGDTQAIERAEAKILTNELAAKQRIAMLRTVSVSSPATLSNALNQLLSQIESGKKFDKSYSNPLFELAIGKASDADLGRLVKTVSKLDGSSQATLAERLCQRPLTAEMLLDEIAAEKLKKDIVSPNQIRLLASSRSSSILASVKKIWGTVNTTSSAQRQAKIQELGKYLNGAARGNAQRGLVVYDRICGQCHVMHERGFEVGPNITANGRGNFEQLIVSVFDPSLVIGEAFKSVTLRTVDGRVVNGILVEQSPQRTVLKLQGNKQEAFPASEIEEMKQNEKSLMPEGLEEQMTRQEMADLFALLSIEGPIDRPEKTVLSGTPKNLHKP